jgi:Flavodoxin domain
MKALVVYESYFGNTRDVAEAIADGLRSRAGVSVGVDVTLVEVDAAPLSGDGYDLLVVGGPIHLWHMTTSQTRDSARKQATDAGVAPVSTGIGVREWLRTVAPAVDSQSAAAFDTAIKTKWFPVGSAAKAEAAALTHAGYHLMADPEHFFVEETKGPLAGELDRAKAWGASLASALMVPLATS